jgi:hypothetical protein
MMAFVRVGRGGCDFVRLVCECECANIGGKKCLSPN